MQTAKAKRPLACLHSLTTFSFSKFDMMNRAGSSSQCPILVGEARQGEAYKPRKNINVFFHSKMEDTRANR